MPETTFIYVIGQPGSDVVKIGRARNVGIRLSSLQTGSPWPLALLGHWEVEHSDAELHLHEVFVDRWVRGEWFRFPELDAVEQVGRRIGSPPLPGLHRRPQAPRGRRDTDPSPLLPIDIFKKPYARQLVALEREAAAARIDVFSRLKVPVALRTARYSAWLNDVTQSFGYGQGETEMLGTTLRQQLVGKDERSYRFILFPDSWVSGGEEEQQSHIRAMNEHDDVEVRVCRWGATAPVEGSTFTLMRRADWHPVDVLEDLGVFGDLWTNDCSDVSAYVEVYERFWRVAEPLEDWIAVGCPKTVPF